MNNENQINRRDAIKIITGAVIAEGIPDKSPDLPSTAKPTRGPMVGIVESREMFDEIELNSHGKMKWIGEDLGDGRGFTIAEPGAESYNKHAEMIQKINDYFAGKLDDNGNPINQG